jgi:hypothetical protein
MRAIWQPQLMFLLIVASCRTASWFVAHLRYVAFEYARIDANRRSFAVRSQAALSRACHTERPWLSK